MDGSISNTSPIITKRIINNSSSSSSRASPASINTKVPEDCKPTIINSSLMSNGSLSSNPKPNQVCNILI